MSEPSLLQFPRSPDTGRYEEALRALVKTIDWAEQQDEWGDDFEASVLAARDTAKAALQPSGEKREH